MNNDHWIFLCFLGILVVILVYFSYQNNKEGWYHNPRRMSILGEESYPEYWAEQYGKSGENWPYRKPRDFYNKLPTYCGGCWAGLSPTSMFRNG